MKAIVIYVSKSGNSAILAVRQSFGAVTCDVASGWVGLNEKVEVGQELPIPAKTVAVRAEVAKDGTVFNKLVFS